MSQEEEASTLDNKSSKASPPSKLTNAKFVMSNLPLNKKEVVTR